MIPGPAHHVMRLFDLCSICHSISLASESQLDPRAPVGIELTTFGSPHQSCYHSANFPKEKDRTNLFEANQKYLIQKEVKKIARKDFEHEICIT